jgi:hypothetical protein
MALVTAPASRDLVPRPTLPEPTTATMSPSADTPTALWEQRAWFACVDAYKKVFNRKTQEPSSHRYDGHTCAKELLGKRPGDLFLMISGPNRRIHNRRGFEVTLEEFSNSGGTKTLCSTRRNYYSPELEKRMHEERRCVGFPDLLADEGSLVHYKAKRQPISVATTPRINLAEAGEAQCAVIEDHGYTKKIIAYELDGRLYAINGHARDFAAAGLITDGFTRFSPDEMQVLLARGLARCP